MQTKPGTTPRRLTHLYTTKSDPIPFEVDGETIEVVVVKPNTPDMQSIERRAAAARARMRVILEDADSDDSMALRDQAAFADRDSMMSTIVGERIREKSLSIYYEMRSRPEWAEDEYLAGLESLWYAKAPYHAGLTMPIIAASPPADETFDDDDSREEYEAAYKEALRVRDELARFEAAVQSRTREERDALSSHLLAMSDEELIEETEKSLRKLAMEKAYADAYEAQVLYYAVRQPGDLRKKYFESIDEVLSLDDGVRQVLAIGYSEIHVPVLEGKDWPGSPGSSTSSEPTDAEAESPPSGPADATP